MIEMTGDTFIEFRGEKDVLVKYDIDTSGPGSGCSVEWWFYGKNADDHEALNVTPAEEEAIIEKCIASADDRRSDDWDSGP